MSIQIIKNDKINLNMPKFLCDENAVGDHLNKHPLLQLLNVFGFLCVIGRPGSGKTSLTIALITQKKPKIYKKTHHHVIVIMPMNSIGSMSDDPFKGLENIYHDITDINIKEILGKINNWSKEKEKTILYIDDMTASLKKSKIIIETIKELIYNRRHLKLNIIITAQSYVNIPLDVRKNIQNLIMFKPAKKEMLTVFDELIESKKEHFEGILRFVYDQKHNFFFLNAPTGRIFKNYDEIIIHDKIDNLIEDISEDSTSSDDSE